MDVLVIGAHPDDAEIGLGGTIARLAQAGLKVALVDLTDGEPTPHGDRVTRRQEARAAADLLGVNRNTLRKKIRDLDIQVIRTSR